MPSIDIVDALGLELFVRYNQTEVVARLLSYLSPPRFRRVTFWILEGVHASKWQPLASEWALVEQALLHPHYSQLVRVTIVARYPYEMLPLEYECTENLLQALFPRLAARSPSCLYRCLNDSCPLH